MRKRSISWGVVAMVMFVVAYFAFSFIVSPAMSKKSSKKYIYDIEKNLERIQSKLYDMTDKYSKVEDAKTTLYLYVEENDRSVSQNEATDAWIALSRYSDDAYQLMDDVTYLLFEIAEKHGY